MDNVVKLPTGAAKAWRAVRTVYREIAIERGAPTEKIEAILEEMRTIHAALHDESAMTLSLSPDIGLTEEQGQMISQELNTFLDEYNSRISKRLYLAHSYILGLIVEKYR